MTKTQLLTVHGANSKHDMYAINRVMWLSYDESFRVRNARLESTI